MKTRSWWCEPWGSTGLWSHGLSSDRWSTCNWRYLIHRRGLWVGLRELAKATTEPQTLSPTTSGHVWVAKVVGICEWLSKGKNPYFSHCRATDFPISNQDLRRGPTVRTRPDGVLKLDPVEKTRDGCSQLMIGQSRVDFPRFQKLLSWSSFYYN